MMNKRVLGIGTQNYTQVVCMDEPGPGGACHIYRAISVPCENTRATVFAQVVFQKGPVKEVGVNGCHNEDLLAIVSDRLSLFQDGEYACPENLRALDHIRCAMIALQERTLKRKERGVEGTSEK